MKFQIIGFVLGGLITIIGVAELIPAMIDQTAGHSNGAVFFFNALICLFLGANLAFANRNFDRTLSAQQAFFLTTVSWIVIAFFAAIPLYMADLEIDFVDAYFEAMSGFTTTGSTVFSGLDTMSRGVLMWRSMIEWIGGMGIVAFAVIFLPFLQIGGMQLFQTESSNQSDKMMPRSGSFIFGLFLVYCLLTLSCAFFYFLFGMSGFDAINHAMTTISTAGFSTHDRSFGYFSNPWILYTASFFMFLSALPFVLFLSLFVKKRFDFAQDAQVRTLVGIVGVLTLILTIFVFKTTGYSLERSFRHALFNLVSVITTTGYASTDYLKWGSFASVMFLLATYIGGAAGSTSGGPKTMRLIIAAKAVNRQMKGLLYPHGVFAVNYQGRPLTRPIIMSTLGFLGLYVAVNVLMTIAVTMTGVDFITAVSAVATAMANAGCGIGEIVGPSGNFSTLPDGAKWLLSGAMLLGRLEILTVCVLFSREYWQDV